MSTRTFLQDFSFFFIFFSSPKFAHFFTPAEQRNSTNSTALIRNESGTQAKGRDISRVSRGFFENYMVCPHHHHHWSLRAGTRVCLRDGIEPWNSTLHLLSAENSTFSLFFSFCLRALNITFVSVQSNETADHDGSIAMFHSKRASERELQFINGISTAHSTRWALSSADENRESTSSLFTHRQKGWDECQA